MQTNTDRHTKRAKKKKRMKVLSFPPPLADVFLCVCVCRVGKRRGQALKEAVHDASLDEVPSSILFASFRPAPSLPSSFSPPRSPYYLPISDGRCCAPSQPPSFRFLRSGALARVPHHPRFVCCGCLSPPTTCTLFCCRGMMALAHMNGMCASAFLLLRHDGSSDKTQQKSHIQT